MNTTPPVSPRPGLERLTFAELVARTRGLQPWRRIFHAASGVILALGPGALGLDARTTAALLAAGTTGLFVADVLRLRVPAANRLFFTVFRKLASPREAGSLASSTWYALGATLVWALTPGAPAVAAILVLGLADPAASVVGRTWGRTPLGKGTRLGSGTFFGVACAVLLVTAGWPAALPAAVAATVAEVIPFGPDDNLTIPLATAAVLWVFPALPPI